MSDSYTRVECGWIQSEDAVQCNSRHHLHPMKKWGSIWSDSVYIKLETGQIKRMFRVDAQAVKQTKEGVS